MSGVKKMDDRMKQEMCENCNSFNYGKIMMVRTRTKKRRGYMWGMMIEGRNLKVDQSLHEKRLKQVDLQMMGMEEEEDRDYFRWYRLD